MKLLLVILALIMSVVTYSKDSNEYDLKEMKNFLSELPQYRSVLYQSVQNDDINLVAKPVPDWIQNFSQRVQLQLFGEVIINFAFCEDLDSLMTAEFENNLICIQSEELDTLLNDKRYADPKTLAQFVVAHEISHFIHELSIRKVIPYDRSLNNSVSAYGYTFDDFVKEMFGHNDYLIMTPEQLEKIPLLINPYAQKISIMHAEVDTYAYLILQSLDIEIPITDLFTLFHTFSLDDADGPGSIDSENRIRALVSFQKSQNL